MTGLKSSERLAWIVGIGGIATALTSAAIGFMGVKATIDANNQIEEFRRSETSASEIEEVRLNLYGAHTAHGGEFLSRVSLLIAELEQDSPDADQVVILVDDILEFSYFDFGNASSLTLILPSEVRPHYSVSTDWLGLVHAQVVTLSRRLVEEGTADTALSEWLTSDFDELKQHWSTALSAWSCTHLAFGADLNLGDRENRDSDPPRFSAPPGDIGQFDWENKCPVEPPS